MDFENINIVREMAREIMSSAKECILGFYCDEERLRMRPAFTRFPGPLKDDRASMGVNQTCVILFFDADTPHLPTDEQLKFIREGTWHPVVLEVAEASEAHQRHDHRYFTDLARAQRYSLEVITLALKHSKEVAEIVSKCRGVQMVSAVFNGPTLLCFVATMDHWGIQKRGETPLTHLMGVPVKMVENNKRPQ